MAVPAKARTRTSIADAAARSALCAEAASHEIGDVTTDGIATGDMFAGDFAGDMVDGIVLIVVIFMLATSCRLRSYLVVLRRRAYPARPFSRLTKGRAGGQVI